MHVAPTLSLPDELEQSRVAGELVVFAGAGVSMGAPARLPSFQRLARAIAERKIGWTEADAVALDRYLGRAEAAGIDVQARAREFLSIGGSHTPLHEDLLRLFTSRERIRLITTNFDPHFASAEQSVFPDAPAPRYVGPALPPGRDFSGITQLHGALDHPHTRLVLTDRDFADAYMADGWATRFLVRVFTDRTVLFVGYSVSDPLIQYLLHAIPPTGRWYGLWHCDEVDHWTEHNIRPVTFGTAASGDRYGDLDAGMRYWSWYAAAPPSDHQRETERLIKSGPPVSPTDADYLRARVATGTGRETFFRCATSERWFEWATSNGYVDALTDTTADPTAAYTWGSWCLANFMGGDAPPLVRWLQAGRFMMHPAFASAVSRYLWVTKPWPAAPAVRQLIALLVSQPPSTASDAYDWQWLLQRLVESKWYSEALIVLRHATQVRLEPSTDAFRLIRAAYAADNVDSAEVPLALGTLSMNISTRIEAAQLEQFLDEHGADLASGKAEAMLSLAEQRIEEAYELLDLARGATGAMDWLSYGRTAVAPSDQDSLARGEDVLVDMARTAIDHLAANAPARLDVFAARLDESPRNLLCRIALYAYAQRLTYPSETLLARAVQVRWPQRFWLRPELYLVLDAHFARAPESARAAFIAALEDEAAWGEVDAEDAARARYDMAVKLHRIAPESAAARAFADSEQRAHPDWEERDADGYLSRVQAGWGGLSPSPLQLSEMVGWDSPEALRRIRHALENPTGFDSSQSLLETIRGGAAAAPAWGASLLEAVASGDSADVRVAEALLWGLREGDITVESKLELLQRIGSGEWAQELVRSVAALLDRWADDLRSGASAALLDAMDGAADTVFARSATERPNIEGHGWFESAINHPAGQAAQVWWRTANARDRLSGRAGVAITDAERTRWQRVMEDETPAGDYGRPVLGMATDRLTAGDLPWAASTVFGAFDPTHGFDKAAQLWDGRLMGTRWLWNTVAALQPSMRAFFNASAQLVPHRAKQLGDWVALLVAFPTESGFTLELLEAFVDHASEDARVAFASELPDHVAALSPDAREHLWREILAPYWRDRRTNMPRALSTGEVREMIGWAPALPEVADEVLEALRGSPGEHIEHADHTLWQWTQDAAWVRAHPAEAAGIVQWLCERHCMSRWSADNAAAVLNTCVDAGAAAADVRAAVEALMEFAPENATALLRRLDGQ